MAYLTRSTRPLIQSRGYISDTANASLQEAWLFVDSVFPIRVARWDLRHYIGIFRKESLVTRLHPILSSVKTHNFNVISFEPHQKDGGVFVKFEYSADESHAGLQAIEKDLKDEVQRKGGIPSWIGVGRGDIWLVKGTPWREDMNCFASPILKLAFEGPDVHQETLYSILRPYGHIKHLTAPTPVPPGSLRSTSVTFSSLRSAAIARNVVHGLRAEPSTFLRAAYEQPIQAHVIRNWLSSHPKIVLPIVVLVLGTLTYTIFDPIRAWMVQAKIMDWFNYREFRLWKWLSVQTAGRLSSQPRPPPPSTGQDVWKERKEAETALKSYLSDFPTTVAFVHGPQGSGKSRMLSIILQESNRKSLIIDCAALHKTSSDTTLVAGLAQQTGYWPVFTFLNSVNNLLDLASVGMIGQKAGLSSSLPEELDQILSTVTIALSSLSSSHRSRVQHQIKAQQIHNAKRADDEFKRERIRRGIWHDGRIDCVAGNGVMSELGFGDERLGDDDSSIAVGDEVDWEERRKDMEDERRKDRSVEDVQSVGSLPIVVVKNYASKGGTNKEELFCVLARWAAALAENQVAHVIVISDNRENSTRLAKALPSKPLNVISLYDADATSALSFVKQKLHDAHFDLNFTQPQIESIERLGGRASDLESLIHKVRSGLQVEEAVEDIINRGVGELRKNAFGDDVEDAKNLPWSREQAWAVLRLLSNQDEAPYYGVLMDFPFKGDETPLKNMEHAELITIGIHNGRPSTIRPGKPVFKYVFERLVEDPVFQASQDISFNEKVIASSESTVRSCEQELTTLNQIGPESGSYWWGGKRATAAREKYLLDKMLAAELKIERLEKKNVELTRVLSKGGKVL